MYTIVFIDFFLTNYIYELWNIIFVKDVVL